jgi:hypothetical protein
MSSLAQLIRQERSLEGAQRLRVVEPAMEEAAQLALAHARARLALPPFTLVWVHRPGGNMGETWWHHDGQVEVLVNLGADLSPRSVAWTILHELKHVADGERPRMSAQAAEDGANAFAYDVVERQTEDFYKLDWRRPSGRR